MLTRRQILALAATGVGSAALAPLIRRLASVRAEPSTVHVLAVPEYDRLDPATIAAAVPATHLPRIRSRRVLLKPNLIEFAQKRPIHTDPRLILATIEAFSRLGAADLVVAEGPGHRRDTDYLLGASGLGEIVRRAGVRFVDLNLDTSRPHPIPGGGMTGLEYLHLPHTLTDADYVVSMPKMKTHHWVAVTLSLKNLFGVLPGTAYGWPKNFFHWVGIPASILDVNRTVMADLAIVDGVVGMEGDGPLNGEGVNSGVVVVGEALAAVDATCCRLMGMDPTKIPYLAGAAARHGSIASRDITIEGTPIATLARPYTAPPAWRAAHAGSAGRAAGVA
jgi:uncharacterized protein (DUF362 family)